MRFWADSCEMEERLSILEEEKFAECRLCNHLVGSFNPTCKSCGLEMSSEGIIELAEIKDYQDSLNEDNHNKNLDFADVFNLKNLACLSLAFTIVGTVFSLSTGFNLMFKVYFWLGLFFYVSFYISWNNKFSKAELSAEEMDIVKREKTISLLIFLSSSILGAIIYIFLLD